MDFKVAGTKDGITAIQMDIKVQGITIDIMREAMKEAKKSRLFIIGKLERNDRRAERRELSQFAPRMIVVKINPAKIKDVIGPGGKMINKIIADTGAEKIDIEDDGTVYITSARRRVGRQGESRSSKNLTQDVKSAKSYKGTVVRIIPIGAFVQILPGKDGLVHISQLAPQRGRKGGRRRLAWRQDDGQSDGNRLARPRESIAQGGTWILERRSAARASQAPGARLR